MKRLIALLSAICFICGSIFFFITKIDKTVTGENHVETEGNMALEEKSIETIINQDSHLELIKRPFEPDLIRFYIGKVMRSEIYTLDDIGSESSS